MKGGLEGGNEGLERSEVCREGEDVRKCGDKPDVNGEV